MKPLTIDERKRRIDIINEFTNKYSEEKIASLIGITKENLAAFRYNYGLPKARYRTTPKQEIERCLVMYANGVNSKDISISLKLNRLTVQKIIKEYYTFKEKSYNTLTLNLESKINYE